MTYRRHLDVRQLYTQVLQEVVCILVDLNSLKRDSRNGGHKVHPPFSLLLLKLQRNTTNGASLDTFHQPLKHNDVN